MTEIIPQQLLVPKKVYIGDIAELRCTFKSTNFDLSAEPSFTQPEAQAILQNETLFSSTSLSQDFDVKNIQITQIGSETYLATITFVPWKTGDLQFPPLQLGDIKLLLQSVQIVSLTAQNNVSVLQSSRSPLLLPGTTYRLYGVFFIILILFILIIQLIIKRQAVSFFIKNKKLLYKYKRNKISTYKKLKKLNDEQTAATSIQNILRHYLELRFDFPFTKSSTSEMMGNFLNITQGLLGDKKNEAFGEIVNIFVRTDFIRYSKNAQFEKDEFRQMVKKIIINIEILEEIEHA